MERDKETDIRLAQEQQLREQLAKQQARQQQKPVVYRDNDGCEVTVMPAGHVFFNVGDWW